MDAAVHAELWARLFLHGEPRWISSRPVAEQRQSAEGASDKSEITPSPAAGIDVINAQPEFLHGEVPQASADISSGNSPAG